MSTAKRVIKNTGFLYAKMGITMFISLYTTRLILNALGASDFGIFTIVGGAIAMLGFLNVAMASATQRFMSYAEGQGNKDKQKQIFNISLALHFFIALFLVLLLLGFGYFFFHGILNIPSDRITAAQVVYASLIVSTAFTVMAVPYEAVLNARENMKYYAIVGIIESLLKLAVAFVVVYYSGDKLIVYGFLMAVIPLITMLIMRVYCHRHYEECVIAPKKYWDRALLKEMGSFAGWSLMGSSSGMLYGYGSSIVLNNFFGTIPNAANGICGQINGQLQVFSNNMLKAFNPVIVKAEGSGRREDMYNLTFTSSKLSVLMYAVFATPFFIESAYILKLWLKDVPEYTELFLQLMIVQVLIEQITLPLGTSISAVGKIRQFNLVNSIVLYLSIPVLYGLYAMGYPVQTLRLLAIGVAIFQSAYKIFFSCFYSNMPLKLYLKEVLFNSALIIFVIFVALTSIEHLLPMGLVRLSVIVSTSFILFVILSYFIVLNKSEKALFKKIAEAIKMKVLHAV